MKTIANSVNLNKIADSGQCFRLLNTAPHVWEYGTSFFIESTGTIITNAEHMLDLDFPYDMVDIAVQHNGNDYLKQACQYSHGIHILQQDLLEMIVTFIISQQKRIPQIRKHVLSLCVDGVFPALECLQSFTLRDWEGMGLGYRSQYLYATLHSLTPNLLSNINTIDDTDEIIYILKQFPGIGNKVANCIALYGLHRLDAFPIDVWIGRILTRYFNGTFDDSWCRPYRGILQLYMFYYERSL